MPTTRSNLGIVAATLIAAIAALIGFALIAPRVFTHADGPKVAAARSDLTTLASALDVFKLDSGHYPATKEGLRALLVSPKGVATWRGPYVHARTVPLDPWGSPYRYRHVLGRSSAGRDGFELVSFGADGKPGGIGSASDIVEKR